MVVVAVGGRCMTLAYVFKLEDRGAGNHIQSACDSSGGVSAAVFSQDTLLSYIHMYPGPTISIGPANLDTSRSFHM